MTRRSVMNDRYRVEQKGKTRKSASAAKPKRAAGESASSAKKSAAKPKSALSRAFGKGGSRPTSAQLRIEPTPEMKKLRRVWWVLMAVAIGVALAMTQTSKLDNAVLNRVVIGVYVLALGGALYLEFGPLRKARMEAAAAAKPGKSGQSLKGGSGKGTNAGKGEAGKSTPQGKGDAGKDANKSGDDAG